jgi:hypothetical protein
MRGFAPEVFSVSTVMRHVPSDDGSFGLGTVRSREENAKFDGILDFERFSRTLRIRWLWLSWKGTRRPWAGKRLPIGKTDMALFAAASSHKGDAP